MLTKSYFERTKKEQKDPLKDVSLFIEKTSENLYQLTEERKTDQAIIDTQVIAAMRRSSKTAKSMFGYLKSMFSLGKHDYPHKMVF